MYIIKTLSNSAEMINTISDSILVDLFIWEATQLLTTFVDYLLPDRNRKWRKQCCWIENSKTKILKITGKWHNMHIQDVLLKMACYAALYLNKYKK